MNQALVICDDEKSSGTYFGFPVFFTSDAVGGEKLCAINKGGERGYYADNGLLKLALDTRLIIGNFLINS